jgi:PKD repeat protein
MIVGIFISSALALPAAFSFGPTAHADAGFDQTVDINEPVNFDGTGSSGIGSLEYTWYYRDGTTETVNYPDPIHAFAKEGVYEVGLLVKDGNGYYDLDTVQITVKNEYPTSVAGTDMVVNEDEIVHFDGSGSWDANNDIVTYEWDFGDNSTSSLVVDTHVYERAGIYFVYLTVTDNDGAFGRDMITVTVNNVVPSADGTANSQTGTQHVIEDEPVSFDASLSSDTPSDLPLLKYSWDFGDGSSGAGVNPIHIYTKEGTYEVILTVSDDDDAYSQDTITIMVQNADPIAEVEEYLEVDEGSSLFLDGSETSDTPSDDPLLKYNWDLETDGVNDDIGWNSKHTWGDDGTFKTTLQVTDDDGAVSTDFSSVSVKNVAPKPSIFDYSVENYTVVHFGLRIAGEKWHDVQFWLYENSTEIAYRQIIRYPGSPNDQMVFINNITIDRFTTYEARIEYTPENDPINGQLQGANPCWLILYLEDGNEFRFHRAFNYNKPNEWEWIIDLSSIVKVTFKAEIYDPGMDTVTFHWDFGDLQPIVSHPYPTDGTYPTKVSDHAMHVYVISATYQIRLKGEDDEGHHNIWIFEFVNEPPMGVDNLAPRAFVEVDMLEASEDEDFQFSGSAIDLLVNNLTYYWNFDDGDSAEGMEVNHSYKDKGVYLVTLTVTDSQGASGVAYLFVTVKNAAPSTDAGYNQSVNEDGEVFFDASSWDTTSDLPLLSYAWDFGDGNKGFGKMPSHTYTKSGTYNVTLTVTDNNGAQDTDAMTVKVINPAPESISIVTESYVFEDEIIFFTGTATDTPSDEPLLTYSWDFGDGTFGYGRNPTHAYSLPGAFEVRLYVIDDDLLIAVKNETLLVTNVNPSAYAGPTHIELYGPAITLNFTGVGLDTASDQSSLTYSWFVGSTMVEYTPVVTMDFTATAIHVIWFRVMDSHLGKSTAIEIRIEFTLDSDGDCLSDEMEANEGTQPDLWDTDYDNLMDFFEVHNYPTDPLDDDTDSDLLNDWEEITFFGLSDPDEDGLQNPVDWDSDGEWIMDGLDSHPLQYDDTDGSILFWDAIMVDNHIGRGVSVVMHGGSAYTKPSISSAVPPKPLDSGIGIYASINTTDSPPFSAQIRMRYDDTILPHGISESRLRMFPR